MIRIVVAGVSFGSLIFLLSWGFRYACLVIIARRVPETVLGLDQIRTKMRKRSIEKVDQICEAAAVNELSFPEVQALLLDSNNVDLENLCESLDHDYVAVNQLLNRGRVRRKAARYELLMLASDYLLLKAWYRFERFCSLQRARYILEEMTWVVGHFADLLLSVDRPAPTNRAGRFVHHRTRPD